MRPAIRLRASARVLLLALAATATMLATAQAQSRDYPSRPIRLIVAWPAGGGGDVVGRVLAEKLGRALGQAVVVENMPGASGTIGTQFVARAAPDGYTLLLGQANNNVIAPAVFKVSYDPVGDFTPITYVGYVPNVLVVTPSLPVKSVSDLIATARAGATLSYASAGYGSIQNISGEQFRKLTGANITHIPYKGSSAALTDLLAGRVSMTFDTMPSILPSVQAGKLRALAVSTPRRVAVLPDVPTYVEAGLAEVKLTNWYSLMGPKGLPPAVVQRLDRAMHQSMDDPEVRRKLDSQGMVYGGPATPAQFGVFLADETRMYRQLVGELGIKVE